MATRLARRFGARTVQKGKMKGSLHVAPKSYVTLRGELSHLEEYLSHRLLPREPEDRVLANLLLILQNLIEYELEQAIELFIKNSPTKKNVKFLNELQTGFVSFKAKFTWAYARRVVTDHERDVMEEIRIIRNAQTHARREPQRRKYQYFGKPLLVRRSIQKLFMDVNALVLVLRAQSGNADPWEIVPPGYAKEMGWIA